jgi:uncharacterized protein (TIGR02679 family)
VVTDRPSLRAENLDDVWDAVRRRLEARGDHNRGRVRLPELTSPARLALKSLLGRAPAATLDLARLEAALVGLGVGSDLASALAELDHAVSSAPAARRAERAVASAGREAARAAAGAWPEAWAPAWIDEVIRAGVLRGMDAQATVRLVGQVRRVLDRLDETVPSAPISRVDLAADALGSSHALDAGSRLEAACTRALAHRLGPAEPRDLWERAGAHLDLTSGPVLVWNLTALAPSPLATLLDDSTRLGVPLHLTQLALRSHPVEVERGADVLVVENPRVVEAAAQVRSSRTVVSSNGNPSGAVRLLLAQLARSGAKLRYHGDFDAAGLAMCARMAAGGLEPWRMSAADYLEAVEAADEAGVELPLDAQPAPATPWDSQLEAVFDERRAIVHEERLLDLLIGP